MMRMRLRMPATATLKFERDEDGDYEAEAAGIRFRILRASVPTLCFALMARRICDDEDLTNWNLSWTTYALCRRRAEEILAEHGAKTA